MAPAVTAVLDRDEFSRTYSAGRVWKLAGTLRGFKPSRKPVLWLQAVPTAGRIPGNRRRTTITLGSDTATAPDWRRPCS